jgi:exosortase
VQTLNQPVDDGILEEFRVEFKRYWKLWPNKGFFFVLLAAWLVIFQFFGNSTKGYIATDSLYGWMYQAYNPADEHAVAEDAHANFVPFIIVGLLWWKRKELFGLKLKVWWPALIGLALALLIHVFGYAVQQTRISIMGLCLGIYSLTGLAWGPAWMRATVFPFFLFGFMVPMGSLSEIISFPLRLLVCRLVEFIGHYILAIDVIRQGTMLAAPDNSYQYEVAAACSGIRSLMATMLLSVVYAFAAFGTWWKRGVLISLCVPFAVLGNLVRMLAIVVAAEFGGREWGNKVHDDAILSLIPYVPALFGLILAGRWLGEDAPEPKAAVPADLPADAPQKELV